MPRPSNTDRRRQEIVAGLMKAMAEHGYAGATIPRIAKAAGLAPGLVHYHFGAKREILLALVARLRAGLRRRYRVLCATQTPMPAFIDAHLSLGPGADPAAMACWVQIVAESVREPDVRRAYRRAMAEEGRELERIVGRRAAGALLSAVHGALVLGVTAPGVIPRGSAAEMVRRMAEGSVRK